MHANDPVNRIMTEPVLTIGPDDSVREMLQLFIDYPVHHLPVVKERCVVGMLSSADLMKLEFFLPPPGAAREQLLDDRFRVSKVMRTPVVTVTEHETVQRAAELMAKNGVHSLPVVNGEDHLIGIVTTTDMMFGCLRSGGATAASASDSTHVHAIDARYAQTIAHARVAVDTNSDPQGIAAALLRCQHRLSALELVTHEAKRYLNGGQDERLLASFRKAIERADRLEQKTGRPSMLGLDAGE